MSMSVIKQILILNLGANDPRPGSNNNIVNTDDAVGCTWSSGQVILVLEPTLYGFVIDFQRLDTFGLVGDAVRLFKLPRNTPIGRLVAAVVASVRHYRDGETMLSPYRWGLVDASTYTLVADVLVRRGLSPVGVSAQGVQYEGQCDAGSRTVSLHQLVGEPWLTISVRHGSSADTSVSAPDRWLRFPLGISPAHLVVVIEYWVKLESTSDAEFNSFSQGIQTPNLTLHKALRALHHDGFRLVRADSNEMRELSNATLLPGRDCYTLRNPMGRLVILGKSCDVDGSPLTGVWTLHTFASVLDQNNGSPSGAIRSLVCVDGLLAHHALPGPATFDIPIDKISPEDLTSLVATVIEGEGVYATDLSLMELSLATNLDHLRVFLYQEDARRRDLRTAARAPRPELELLRTPEDAERVTARWMRWMGYDDADVTRPGADGGIDVTSPRCVAQVKTETLPVGRPAIQRLHGVATGLGKEGLFFSLSGYTSQAIEWADVVKMPLFRFDFQGQPEGANTYAQKRLD